MSAKNGREALPSPASKDGELDALSRVPAGRAVLRTGLPLAVAMASHALINLVDLALVGRLGKGAAAAAHVASVVNFVPMIVGNSISVAAMAVLSQWIGSGDRERAREFARRSLWFMLVCGTAVSVATALPAAPCIDSIGSEGAVRTDAIHYLVVSNLGCLPMFLLMQTTAIMRAAGETVAPLVVLLAANLLNLVLDVVLLFGWDAVGIDAIGVVGAAYATVAARTVAALLSLWWLFRVRHRFSLSGVEPRRTRMPVAVPLLRGAWPQVVQIGLRAALAWLLTALVQRRSGDDGTAALSVTTRLDTLVLFSALGFASAATTIAGRAVARGEVARARSVGWHAGIQALLFGGAIVLLFQHFAEPLLRLFLPTAEAPVVAAFVLYLTIAAVAQPFGACALGAMGAPHGAGRMLAPLIIDLVGFTALFAALLSCPGLGLADIYLATVVGAGGVAIAHLALVARGGWARGVRVTD